MCGVDFQPSVTGSGGADEALHAPSAGVRSRMCQDMHHFETRGVGCWYNGVRLSATVLQAATHPGVMGMVHEW